MYKHSLLHYELHDRSASAQFSSCQMNFSWNKLYTKEIKITVIFDEKLPHHKWHGKWKFSNGTTHTMLGKTPTTGCSF